MAKTIAPALAQPPLCAEECLQLKRARPPAPGLRVEREPEPEPELEPELEPVGVQQLALLSVARPPRLPPWRALCRGRRFLATVRPFAA